MGTYLVVVLDFFIVGVGFFYYKTYINKCVFYSDLLSFCQSLNNSVYLHRQPIKKAVEQFNFNSNTTKNKLLKLLEININTYCDNLTNSNTQTNIPNHELYEIKNSFNFISNSFGEQTKEHINCLEQTVKFNLNKAEKQKKEKGLLYFKLSIILALAITILML